MGARLEKRATPELLVGALLAFTLLGQLGGAQGAPARRSQNAEPAAAPAVDEHEAAARRLIAITGANAQGGESLRRCIEQRTEGAGAEWTAPENPNPQEILREAQNDASAGRFALALQKQVWFHRYALQFNRGLSGVRLSFALSYWRKLADSYPPALSALQGMRDEAWTTTLAAADGRTAWPSFQEFAAINRTLGEESRTATAFAQLDREKPSVAERVASVARPALIRARELTLCAKYVNADTWQTTLEAYRSAKSITGTRERDAEMRSFEDRRFTNDAATMVSLLVTAGRQAEAERLAAEAMGENGDAEFAAAIDRALKGSVPEPWP